MTPRSDSIGPDVLDTSVYLLGDIISSLCRSISFWGRSCHCRDGDNFSFSSNAMRQDWQESSDRFRGALLRIFIISFLAPRNENLDKRKYFSGLIMNRFSQPIDMLDAWINESMNLTTKFNEIRWLFNYPKWVFCLSIWKEVSNALFSEIRSAWSFSLLSIDWWKGHVYHRWSNQSDIWYCYQSVCNFRTIFIDDAGLKALIYLFFSRVSLRTKGVIDNKLCSSIAISMPFFR